MIKIDFKTPKLKMELEELNLMSHKIVKIRDDIINKKMDELCRTIKKTSLKELEEQYARRMADLCIEITDLLFFRIRI